MDHKELLTEKSYVIICGAISDRYRELFEGWLGSYDLRWVRDVEGTSPNNAALSKQGTAYWASRICELTDAYLELWTLMRPDSSADAGGLKIWPRERP